MDSCKNQIPEESVQFQNWTEFKAITWRLKMSVWSELENGAHFQNWISLRYIYWKATTQIPTTQNINTLAQEFMFNLYNTFGHDEIPTYL